MNENELTSFSLAELAALIRKKSISPLDLTKAYLKRIEAIDEGLNTFITLTAELAIEQAGQAEAELARGETIDGRPLGMLHGVPIALKDLIETAGIRTTAGSKFFAENIPLEDAQVYKRLRLAGAILLGKNNMHEIALGLTSVNPHFGAVHNPWAYDRVAGGSSGGSAAALAARLCAGALGSDTGGSVRVPAALCGIAGLKPTYGRISLRGVIPLSWNLDHVGTMARRVDDLAMLLQVIAGYDPGDPYSINIPVENYFDNIKGGIQGWRVALASGDYFHKTDEVVRNLISEAAVEFEKLGANVDLVPFPEAHSAALNNGLMVVADAAAFHTERLKTHPESFGEDVRQRLKVGAELPLNDYIQARRSQTLLRRQLEQFFESFNLLLLPTTPVPAPPIEGPSAVELAKLLTRYTAPFNLTGLPAISIPCGFTPEGLPVGLQIIGRPWAEAKLLQAAHAYEEVTEWHLMEPDL
jgi:aspartyl-tRNA(Asn)/glutamyl-tRNA(Gln) amidotransferase subunit A